MSTPPAIPTSALARALPAYRNFSVVRTSCTALIYKAEHIHSNKLVAIKIAVNGFDRHSHRWQLPTRGQTQQLVMQFDTLKAVEQRNIPNFIRPTELKPVHIRIFDESDRTQARASMTSPVISFRSWAMITSWNGAQTLTSLSATERYADGMPLSEMLPVSVQLCSIVGAVHKELLPRRGLSACSIMYEPHSARVELLGYGLPSMDTWDPSDGNAREKHDSLPVEDWDDEISMPNRSISPSASPSTQSADTSPRNQSCSPAELLPLCILDAPFVHGKPNFLWQVFASPEQTGRVYRATDTRSDIYSLGVIFFVMLTGRLPLVTHSTADSLELIHLVITRIPCPVNVVRPTVPGCLATIVSKCLHKDPGERYQSVHGLAADLFRVYMQLVEFSQAKIGRPLRIPNAVSESLNNTQPPTPRSGLITPPTTNRSGSFPTSPCITTSPSIALHSFAQQIDMQADGEVNYSKIALAEASHIRSQSTGGGSCYESRVVDTSDFTQAPTDEELGLDDKALSTSIFLPFVLGREDEPTRLSLPTNLYGRDEQIRILRSALQRTISIGPQVITVSGFSGCGKSALVRTVLSEVNRSSLVLHSKLELFNHSPYSMWRRLVGEFIINIFQQSRETVDDWRARILAAVGQNASLVTDLFPILTRLIGNQCSPSDLPAAQASQRVSLTLTSFLVCLCSRKQPVIIFFDDVQRADKDSLDLLENVAKSSGCQNVSFVLAYRSDEVDETHPTIQTIDRLRELSLSLTEIECPPLTLSEIQQLVADALRTSLSKALSISLFLSVKTKGNAFFARQLLVQMQREKQLVYRVYSPQQTGRALQDTSSGQDQVIGEWVLASVASLARSAQLDVSKGQRDTSADNEVNIIKLIQTAIMNLDPNTQKLLSLAACLGSSFGLSNLTLVSQKEISAVSLAMTEALGQELIELAPVADSEQSLLDDNVTTRVSHAGSVAPLSPSESKIGSLSSFHFVHDRVQQACLSLIPSSEMESTHLRIAELLLAQGQHSESFMSDHLFEIASHVVNARGLIVTGATKAREWAEFLMNAAKKAETSAAYDKALSYVTTVALFVGVDELDNDCGTVRPVPSHRSEEWRDNYSYTFELTFRRAKLEYLNRNFEVAERELADALAEHVVDQRDRVAVYMLLQDIQTTVARASDALETGRKALNELGFPLPVFRKLLSEETLPTVEYLMSNISLLPCDEQLCHMLKQEFEQRITNRSIPTLIDTLRECVEWKHQAISQLLAGLIANSYCYEWALTEPICLLNAIHMLEHGIAAGHAYGIEMLAIQFLKDPEELISGRSTMLANLGMSIHMRYPDKATEARLYVAHAMMRMYCGSSEERYFWVQKGRQSAINCGHPLIVGYSCFVEAGFDSWHLSLGDAERQIHRLHEINNRAACEVVANVTLDGYLLANEALNNPTSDEQDNLSDSEKLFIQRADSTAHHAGIIFRVARARSFYILNQPEAAVDLLTSCSLKSITGMPDAVTLVVIRILSICMLIRNRSAFPKLRDWSEERTSLLTAARADMRLLEAWKEGQLYHYDGLFHICSAEFKFTEVVYAHSSRPSSPHSSSKEEEFSHIASLYRLAITILSPGFHKAKYATPRSRRASTSYAAETPGAMALDHGADLGHWPLAAASERYANFLAFRQQPESAMVQVMNSFRSYQQFGSETKVSQMVRNYSNQFSSVLKALGVNDVGGSHPLIIPHERFPRSSAHRSDSIVSLAEDSTSSPAPPAKRRIFHTRRPSMLDGQLHEPNNWQLRDSPREGDDFDNSSMLLDDSLTDQDTKVSFADLDLKAVLNATQSISSEIVMPKLLSTVMKKVLRVSGAERAILFSLSSDQTWKVDAYLNALESYSVYVRPSLIDSSSDDSSDGSGEPKEQDREFTDEYPVSIMNYVCHSHQPVILSDAVSDPMFCNDPTIQQKKVRSLLCFPLMHRGGLTSALYLDNSTSPAMFRREKLLVAKLIAAQVAISIDNARLYERVTKYTRTLESCVEQRTEQLEKASREAQKANTAKSSFLANMSHEIRTPMNGVIGGCQLLEHSGDLNSDQREVLNIVRSSAEAMLTIINDILDLSKIEANKVSLSISRFAIRECMENAMNVVASRAHSKGLEFQYCAKLDVPYLIDGDSARLTQIFFNLLSNAVKFTAAGEVTLTVDVEDGDPLTARDQFNALDQSKSRQYMLHFVVRDTGMGVPKKFQQLLFKPFSQVHVDSARNARNGTGLGLTISSHLAALMGGKIWVESEAGAGSAFHFTIACTGSDSNRPRWLQRRVSVLDDPLSPMDDTCVVPRPHFTCLLIDQYETTRNWMVEAAKYWGITMLTARNINEAEVLLTSSTTPDLFALIIDYRSVCTVELRESDDSEILVQPPTPEQAVRALERAEAAAAHECETAQTGPDDIHLNYAVDQDRRKQLLQAVMMYREAHATQDGSLGRLPIIDMGPISIRSLFVGEQRVCCGYISSPVKSSTLYETLRDAAQRMMTRDLNLPLSECDDRTSSSPSCDLSIQLISSSTARTNSSSSQRSSSSSSSTSDNSLLTSPDPSLLDLVFVVDDNPVNRKVLRRMLTRFGYRDDQLAAAENGQVAVTYLHTWLEEHADLGRPPRVCIIMDKTMPVMDGLQSTLAIRASPQIREDEQPFIVALTANAMSSDRQICLSHKMDEYIPKPVTMDALANMLNKANEKWMN